MGSGVQRTIMFRGIRKRGKGFVYGDLVRKFNTTYIVVYIKESNRYEDIEVIPETVGQFTGASNLQPLCKQQGTIDYFYEGDIVQYREGIRHWSGEFKGPVLVQFDDNGFYPFNGDDEYAMCECDVILLGNIHENPELLEVQHGK